MKKAALGTILTILLGGGAVGGYKVIQDNKADIFENSVHEVVHVVDADTFDIENDTRIRLLGIDAPESTECYFAESKAFLDERIEGKHVYIEKDISGSDAFDRLLRYAYIPADEPEDDDVLLNELLVREGIAFADPVAPDNRYQGLLKEAQEEARREKRGVWGACDTSARDTTRPERQADTAPPNASCIIKGNISEKGYGMQYFTEGCPNYNRIKIDPKKGEQYFCSAQEALDAGFTRSASCDNSF